MAAPRRSTLGFLLICLTVLALTEWTVIRIAVLPLPSTRTDWLLATGCIAPMTAAFLLWLAAAIARIVTDVLALLRHIGQWITRLRKSHHPTSATPSPSTSSAAYPSSSAGWPSAGPWYTSPPGKGQHHEP